MLNQFTFEIENKLEKEQSNLDLLKERIERSGQITKSMLGILNSFEQRLSKLEETILPVYNETGNLQRRQQNIEKTLGALDTVINYYFVSQEVESTIREGPSPTADGQTKLEPFLKAMDKLQTAQEYFEKHNPQSVELENVSTLFNTGGMTLKKEFQELLSKHSKPVPPVVLLDLINADEETSNDETPPSLHNFPENISEELMRIADWLITHHKDEYMNVYARVRAVVLEKSMKHLRDQQKNASGGSMQNVQGMISSPMVKPKFQGSGRKVSKRLQHVLEKKANKMFLRASQTLEQSTGLTLSNRRPTLLEPREDVVEEQEMVNYLETVMALQKLIQSERSLMVGIIPLQHQHKVFEIIIKDALDSIVQDGENIAARAKKCISRHDFAAVLVVFPILKHLLKMKPEFEKTMQGCDHSVQTKYASILQTLHVTGAKALEDFIESVRNDTNSQLPKDGTVHEITSNVLVFLEQLIDYEDIIGSVLSPDPNYNGALMRINPPTYDKNKALLGIYIKKVLVQLNSTLMSKSDVYSDVFLKAIFRLNNNHHILKSLQRSKLLDLVKISEPDCENNYFDMIQENKKQYSQSWAKVLNYIWSTEDSQVMANKMKDKDRSGIKEKFAGFNKEIDEISRVQRGYSIPDVELRESLKRDNKELILPKYNAFYERWYNYTFSKNPDKYIKYTPSQVSAMIDRFFDVAA